MTNLVNTDEWVNCGNILIDFYYNDGSQTAIDPQLFGDQRPISTDAGEFTLLQTVDYNHIGVYDIVYFAYYKNYSTNRVESQ